MPPHLCHTDCERACTDMHRIWDVSDLAVVSNVSSKDDSQAQDDKDSAYPKVKWNKDGQRR